MRPWGVKATVIEPGVHKTPMASVQNYTNRFTAAWDDASPEAQEEFGKKYLEDGMCLPTSPVVPCRII